MKLIFIVMFAANIIFFGYSYFLGDKKAEEKQAHVSTVIDGRFAPLQLISERDGKSKKQGMDVTKITSAPVDADKQCLLVGPYVELLHAEFLVERLSGLGIQSAIKNIEIADGKSFWVYMKPEMSEKEALRRLYEVQAKSIDSYIIPSGELANGISFGQFSSAIEANQKAEAVRGQGYAVEIKELIKNHTEVWVEVKTKKDQKINDEQWLDLLKEEKTVEKRQNYCLGVANT